MIPDICHACIVAHVFLEGKAIVIVYRCIKLCIFYQFKNNKKIRSKSS